jgi:hypothetical protein
MAENNVRALRSEDPLEELASDLWTMTYSLPTAARKSESSVIG